MLLLAARRSPWPRALTRPDCRCRCRRCRPQDARIAELESELRQPRESSGALALAEARVHKLEGQVTQLSEMLQAKAPKALRPAGRAGGETLAELIRAAGPSDEQQAAHAQLQAQLDEARAALVKAEAAHERRLRSLRQAHDKIKAGYELKIAQLDEQLAPAALGGAKLRARELEAQLDEVRTFYTKKVRALEAQLAAAGRDAHRQTSPPPARRAAPRAAPREQPTGGGAASADEPLPPPATVGARRGAAAEAQRVLAEERDALAARLEASEARYAMLERESARIGEMQSAFTDSSVQVVCAAVSRLAAQLDEQLSVAVRQVDQLAKDAALSTGRRMPASVEEMSRRLLELEAKHATREAQLERAAERVRHAADVELFVLRQECSNALRLKDLQIESFRGELDGLISGLGMMQPAN